MILIILTILKVVLFLARQYISLRSLWHFISAGFYVHWNILNCLSIDFTVHYITVQYSTVQYSKVQYSTVHLYTSTTYIHSFCTNQSNIYLIYSKRYFIILKANIVLFWTVQNNSFKTRFLNEFRILIGLIWYVSSYNWLNLKILSFLWLFRNHAMGLVYIFSLFDPF